MHIVFKTLPLHQVEEIQAITDGSSDGMATKHWAWDVLTTSPEEEGDALSYPMASPMPLL